MTLLGAARVERAYCDCRHCRADHRPRDRALELVGPDLSRGATEVVALAGALGNFAEAAERTLPKLSGLRVSESTAERATHAAGAAVGERLAAGQTFGPTTRWAWSPDAEGKTSRTWRPT